MFEITVSKAEPSDTEALGNISHQVSLLHYRKVEKEFTEPKLENDITYLNDCIKDDNSFVLKATVANKPVGYIITHINTYPEQHFKYTKKGLIGSIGVDENYRGQGIGTALIKAAEEELKKQGITVMEINVYSFNESAEKLYERLGYKDKSHRRIKFLK